MCRCDVSGQASERATSDARDGTEKVISMRQASFPTPRRQTGSVIRPFVTRLSAFLILALVVAACGGGGSGQDSAGEGGGDGQVEISMWVSREQYEPTDVFYESLERDHPNITVNVELVPDDDLFFQLIRMREANEPLPDIVHLDDYFGVPLYESGLAMPLNELMDRWETEDPESFNNQADAVFVTAEDGSIVGLAPTGTIDVLYYRSDWFEEAGVELPLESWEDVLDAARAVKEAHPNEAAWALPATRGQGVNWLITMMSAAGVEFDGAVPQLQSEEGEYVINFLQTLRREDLAPNEVLAWGEDEVRGAFIGGQAAIIYDGARSTNEIGEALEEQGITYPDRWMRGRGTSSTAPSIRMRPASPSGTTWATSTRSSRWSWRERCRCRSRSWAPTCSTRPIPM